MRFNMNEMATGKLTNEINQNLKKNTFHKINDILHYDIYCVRRCGFYKGRYTISKKKMMIKNKEYNDDTGCNGIPWVAHEGTYSECKYFIRLNRTHMEISHF